LGHVSGLLACPYLFVVLYVLHALPQHFDLVFLLSDELRFVLQGLADRHVGIGLPRPLLLSRLCRLCLDQVFLVALLGAVLEGLAILAADVLAALAADVLAGGQVAADLCERMVCHLVPL
jgi:hypothetical protein